MEKHRVVADLASEVRPCHGVAQLRHSMLSRAPWCWNLTADVLPEAPFLSLYIYICIYIYTHKFTQFLLIRDVYEYSILHRHLQNNFGSLTPGSVVPGPTRPVQPGRRCGIFLGWL